MIEKNNDFAMKHREDVIDTLKLRARERRVLYGLLIILLITVIYETGGSIFSSLVGGEIPVAALGERKTVSIKPEILKRVQKALAPLNQEYPQYSVRLDNEASALAVAIEAASTPETSEKAVTLARTAVNSIFDFVSHPVIMPGTNVDALSRELNQAAKLLQIKLVKKNEFPGVVFKKAAPVVEGVGQRNLFEFN